MLTPSNDGRERVEPTVFSRAQEVKPNRRRGRPRVRDPARPYAHYRGSRGGERPFCKAPACSKPLRVHEHAVCSTLCLAKLLAKQSWLLNGVLADMMRFGATEEKLAVLRTRRAEIERMLQRYRHLLPPERPDLRGGAHLRGGLR